MRKVGILRSGQRNSWLEIVLDEGKNRHIDGCWKRLESKC